jgi:hypothetical protein
MQEIREHVRMQEIRESARMQRIRESARTTVLTNSDDRMFTTRRIVPKCSEFRFTGTLSEIPPRLGDFILFPSEIAIPQARTGQHGSAQFGSVTSLHFGSTGDSSDKSPEFLQSDFRT